MPKFRKRPVVIEAIQWFEHGDHPEVVALPGWHEDSGYKAHLGWVKTLEGGHIVSPGDWIICGVQGEFYPCKPDIFEETYELVED